MTDTMPAETIYADAGRIADLAGSLPDGTGAAETIAALAAEIRADAGRLIDEGGGDGDVMAAEIAHVAADQISPGLALMIREMADRLIDGAWHGTTAAGDARIRASAQAPLADGELALVRAMLAELYPAQAGALTGFPSPHHIEDVVKHWIENDLGPEIKAVEGKVAGIESDVKGYVEQAVKDDVLPAVGYGVELVMRDFISTIQPVLSSLVKIWGDEVPDSAQIRFGWITATWSDTTTLKKTIASGEIFGVLDQFDASMGPTQAWQVFKLLGPDQVGIDAEVQVPVVDVGLEVQATWAVDDFEKIAEKIAKIIAP